MDTLTLVEVNDKNKFIARQLLTEYGRYLFDELNLKAGKESFFMELDKFPDIKYKSPNGAFFIIYKDEFPIGCAGLKRFDYNVCELKRMYIIDKFRGKGFAKTVIKFLLDKAKLLGYKKILLDTNIEMPAALNAYIKAGFVEIPPYCENENQNPVFLAYYL
jgi:GNAT superfamily N-acetyltransferase